MTDDLGTTECRLSWRVNPDDPGELCYAWNENGWPYHGCTHHSERHAGACVCGCGSRKANKRLRKLAREGRGHQ